MISRINNPGKLAVIFFLFLLSVTQLIGQQKFPVSASTMVNAPYSTYLSDYIEPGSNLLSTSFVFNDFNEPTWTVKLRVRIESTALRLETKPDYFPSQPITVVPGVTTQLLGADLAGYLNPNNMIISGGGATVYKNGKLPEGLYTFCIEILDYSTGKLLSNTSCATAWLNLNDPPKVISPLCGAVIDPSLPQNISFQWQLSNSLSPNSLGTEYRLIVYEVTDPDADPFTAINNGKVLEIFRSDVLQAPSFIYDLSAPPLDIGKTYVYQISAQDIGGRDLYKNNGLSEVCWFHYGYPEGGKIDLVEPDNGKLFGKKDLLYFKWSAPDKKLDQQLFKYRVDIVNLEEGQQPEEAMVSTPLWHSQVTSPTLSQRGMDVVLSKKLKPAADYAWQVTAMTQNQEVAKSEVWTFKGPPLVDWFYAGTHKVRVLTSANNDSLNFSGTGKIRVSKTDSLEVKLENLRLKRIASYWVLEEGDIIYEYPEIKKIKLTPEEEINGEAVFLARKLRLNKEGLDIQGEVNWNLPHPVNSTEKAVVRSVRTWLNYDRFTLLGSALLSNANNFELLEPYGYELQLDEKSDFLIKDNTFRQRFKGKVELPEKIKGSFKGSIRIPFPETNQLFFFKSDSLTLLNNILLVENTGIFLHPKVVVFDFSEDTLAYENQADQSWKGLFIEDLQVYYESFIDDYSQLALNQEVYSEFGKNRDNKATALLDADGIDFKFSESFGHKATFNKFPSDLKNIELEIVDNHVNSGNIQGELLIPVFSVDSGFEFSASITNDGIQPGYLEGLEGSSYVFNEGKGEQEVKLTISRGVFEDKKLINMTVDLEWPIMGVELQSVTGFKAWGDYRIGFDRPNGVRPLDYQVIGKLSEYDITIDAIAAGRFNELYSFAIAAKAVLGDDVAGNNGPPAVNVYTIMPNDLLVASDGEGYAAEGELNFFNEDGSVDFQAVQAEYSSAEKDLKDRLDARQLQITNKVQDDLQRLTSGSSSTNNIESVTAELYTGGDIVNPKDREIGGIMSHLNARQQELVRDMVERVVEELTAKVRDSITSRANNVNNRIRSEVKELTDIVTSEVSDKVSALVNGITKEIANTVKNDKVDLSPAIEDLGETVANAVISEVNQAVILSVDQNITSPITTFIAEDIALKINAHIQEKSTDAVVAALEGQDIDAILRQLSRSTGDLLKEIGDKTLEQISFDNVSGMISSTGSEILSNINTGDIVGRIKRGAEDLLTAALADQAQQILGDELNNAISQVTGIDVPIDFATVGEKFKDPDLRDIFALDPVFVSVDTKIVSFGGYISYTADDPDYGDIWRGDMSFDFKLPTKFGLEAVYINGKKDDFGYWFCQITPPGDNSKPGEALQKEARPLDKPINMGPAQLVGISGRFYHHMIDDPVKSILPDKGNKYGAYLNLIFFDSNNDGKTMRLDVAGEMNTRTSGDYTITFDGNIQIMNEAPEVNKIDENAAVKGEFYFHYNSAEKHFIGYGKVEIKKPGQLCANASVLVDTKPGKWRVEIGNRDDRILVQPGCAGWAPTGWLMVSQSEAELGLGVQYSIYAKSPTMNFAVVKANVALDAGIAFGVVAAVRYKPDFALLRAGVWVDLWANVLINYKLKLKKWKSFSVLELYAQGDLLLIFEPKPSKLMGTLKGRVRLLSIVTLKFNAELEHEI
ncbi:hypothetical protein JMN32_09635 [Fulvivirga sp. 29W222]|uniref:Uncharacterized protein n=1 Tax=Fulvivirga marina TaxID=2494733 RepID=A0A937FY33_9BACT|nr:hypothetical protein [Fulvivirga marina]MBL6446571.1 hypothetical protein [Fulvivirga marina]